MLYNGKGVNVYSGKQCYIMDKLMNILLISSIQECF